jgi:hypothetical protein
MGWKGAEENFKGYGERRDLSFAEMELGFSAVAISKILAIRAINGARIW